MSQISEDMTEQMKAHNQANLRRCLGADLCTLSAGFKQICRSRFKHIISLISAGFKQIHRSRFKHIISLISGDLPEQI